VLRTSMEDVEASAKTFYIGWCVAASKSCGDVAGYRYQELVQAQVRRPRGPTDGTPVSPGCLVYVILKRESSHPIPTMGGAYSEAQLTYGFVLKGPQFSKLRKAMYKLENQDHSEEGEQEPEGEKEPEEDEEENSDEDDSCMDLDQDEFEERFNEW